jgi:hypothetical protein
MIKVKNFVDVKMLLESKTISKDILNVDTSWRELMQKVEHETLRLPFAGNYSCVISGEYIFVEGYSGSLRIDKVFGDKIYYLKSPVNYFPFKLYGRYNKTGSFFNFVSVPAFGSHYLHLEGIGMAICTGDLQFDKPSSLELLQDVCKKIMISREVINLYSLGKTFFPKELQYLQDIIGNGSITPMAKIMLLKEKEAITDGLNL